MSCGVDIDLRVQAGVAVDIARSIPGFGGTASIVDRFGWNGGSRADLGSWTARSKGGASGLERLVLREAARRLTQDLRRAVDGLDPHDALMALAVAYRRFATRHPGLYRALVPRPDPIGDPELSEALDQPDRVIVGVIGGFGVERDRVAHLARAFRSLLHGFVALEREGGFGRPEQVDRSFGLVLEAMAATLADSA